MKQHFMGLTGSIGQFQTYHMLAKADISDVFLAFILVGWREKTAFYPFRCHLTGQMGSFPLLPTMSKTEGVTSRRYLLGIKIVQISQISQ